MHRAVGVVLLISSAAGADASLPVDKRLEDATWVGRCARRLTTWRDRVVAADARFAQADVRTGHRADAGIVTLTYWGRTSLLVVAQDPSACSKRGDTCGPEAWDWQTVTLPEGEEDEGVERVAGNRKSVSVIARIAPGDLPGALDTLRTTLDACLADPRR
jgi:hypothetical protein